MVCPLPLIWSTLPARIVLGLVDDSMVEAAATLAVENGVTEKSVVQLAGGVQVFAPTETLAAGLQNAGVPMPAVVDAARSLGRQTAALILTGDLDPFLAAAWLGDLSRSVGNGFHDFDPFIYAESEAEDRPEDEAFFRAAILDAARDIVEG